MGRIDFQFQRIVPAGDAGDVDVLAGQKSPINVGPAGLEALEGANKNRRRIGRGTPTEDIFETEADLAADRDHDAVAVSAESVLGEVVEVVMHVTGGEDKQRVAGGIAQHEVGRADVARLHAKAE